MRKLFFALAGLAFSFSVSSANAQIIDNGTLLTGSGGSCSSCSPLSYLNWMNFDDLHVASDSTFNSIDFDIVLYNAGTWNASTQFLIRLVDPSHTNIVHDWAFSGADVDSGSLISDKAFTFTYNLGDYFVSAGDYEIGIAADYGAHPTSASYYTAGAASDGHYTQWSYSGSSTTFQNNRLGDLPFRLTINESTAVPAPAGIGLFGLGLLALARRRRNAIA